MRKAADRRLREDLFPDLFIRTLEDRRVLSGTPLGWEEGADAPTLATGSFAGDGAPDTSLAVSRGEDAPSPVHGSDLSSAPLADVGPIALNGSGDTGTLSSHPENTVLGGELFLLGTSGNDVLEITATGADCGSYVLTVDGTPGPTVHFSGITRITFDALDGDDRLVINHPDGELFAPVYGIVFHGGAQATAAGDCLEINGPASATVDTVLHRFDAPGVPAQGNNGQVQTVLGSTTSTIDYTGLEPVYDNTDANHRVFTFTAGSEIVTLTAPGAGGFDNRIGSTLGETVHFDNPHVSLTINLDASGGTGPDTVNIEGLGADFDAHLTVNGGPDDTVNFQTSPTDLGTGNLLVNAMTINVVGVAVSTGGAGTVDLYAARNIAMTSGASITTVDGAITLTAGRAILLSGRVQTGGGNVTLTTGTGDTGVLELTGGGATAGSIASAGGAIEINADDIAITNPAATAIDAGSGRVTIRPADPTDAARQIDLGSNTPGRLGISADEFNRITTTGVVQIGDTFAGDVFLTASISPAHFNTLRINSSGSLTTTAEANTIAVDNLAIAVDGQIGTSGARISTSVVNLAAESEVSGDIFLAQTAGGVTVTTVDDLWGIITNEGDVDLRAGENVTLAAVIARGSLTVTSTSGSIVDTPDATIDVTGQATLVAASEITLGGGTIDNTVNFGSLSLTGTAVSVVEDSSTLLVGVNVESLHLVSRGSIDDSGDIHVTGAAVFDAGANPIILGDQPGEVTNFGSLELIGGVVRIYEDSDTRLVAVEAASLQLDSAGDLVLGQRLDGTPSDRPVRATGPIVLNAAGDLYVYDVPALGPVSEVIASQITADAGGTIFIADLAVLESATGKVTNAPPVLSVGEKVPGKPIVPGDTVQWVTGSLGDDLELGANFTIVVLWDDGVVSQVSGVNANQEVLLDVASSGSASTTIQDDATPFIELDLLREYSIAYLVTVSANDVFATVEVHNDPNIRLSDSSGVDLNMSSFVVATRLAKEVKRPAGLQVVSRGVEVATARQLASTAGAEVRPAAPPPPGRSEDLRPGGEEMVEDERQIYIVKVDPAGLEAEQELLPKDALLNLWALFDRLREKGLPSGLYRLYYKEPGFPRRLVIEFYKSGDTFGEPVREPGRGSNPIPEQPPVKVQEDGPAEALPAPEDSEAETPIQPPPDDAATLPGAAQPADASRPALGGAGGLAVYSARRAWAQDVDRAMEQCREEAFTKAARLRRRLRR